MGRGKVIVAGIGCRRLCPEGDILAALRAAEAATGRRAEAMAAPRFKAGEAGLRAAAALAGLMLLFVEDGAMADVQARCLSRSAAALAATGHPSVAEACAVAVSGGALLQARVVAGRATCALAG